MPYFPLAGPLVGCPLAALHPVPGVCEVAEAAFLAEASLWHA